MPNDWSHLKCPFCGFYPKVTPDGCRELHYVILKLESGGYQREPCPKSGVPLKTDLRTCSFCGQSPAPHKITRLTAEQQAANQAWADSLKVEFHTGHCPHLELPTYACPACFEDHPEAHLP